MIKTFEQYNRVEIDPYGEEDWDEGVYKIKKFFLSDSDSHQNGMRYYLTINCDIVKNFQTLETMYFGTGVSNLNEDDIKKLKSGEYVITNGYSWNCESFQKITYEELKKKLNLKLLENKTFENHEDIDPYNEEDWEDPVEMGEILICIDDDESYGKITKGKEYMVISQYYSSNDRIMYQIIDDRGIETWWYGKRFKKRY